MIDYVMIGSIAAVIFCIVIIVFLSFKIKILINKDSKKNRN